MNSKQKWHKHGKFITHALPTSGLISVALAEATNSLKNPSSSVPSMYPLPVERCFLV